MGVLGHFKESAVVHNRTLGAGAFERILSVRYDGEDINLVPGPNVLPKVAIPYAIKQNPLMGSKHPVDPRKFISLVGVEGSKNYPITPIPESVLAKAAQALEVVDRDGSFYGEPMEARKLLKRTPYSAYEASVEAGSGTEFDTSHNV
jgi:hypothetical protein